MEVEILQEDGMSSGRTVALDPTVFGIEPNDHVLWLDVKRIQANKRQGTHKTRERSDVRGSRRKLYRQKGTGNARAGDAKSPIRRTGGRTHGARPRDYTQNLNKKTKRLARRSALSYRAASGNVRVIENFSMDVPSTRQLKDLLALLEVDGQKVLIVTDGVEQEIYRSAQNLQKVNVREAQSLSTVDVLDAEVLLIQEGALDVITDVLSTAQPA
ncbi:50S ribosomal protein L4 [Salisaeta longa]|uniref:50S ribosomal protein L4 n=1 Tax=Salisaeta longa TaxID=503170 RepID=UPI0003B69FCC|nr:50S ribosomal protein L4 [Salisaeta longa]